MANGKSLVAIPGNSMVVQLVVVRFERKASITLQVATILEELPRGYTLCSDGYLSKSWHRSDHNKHIKHNAGTIKCLEWPPYVYIYI